MSGSLALGTRQLPVSRTPWVALSVVSSVARHSAQHNNMEVSRRDLFLHTVGEDFATVESAHRAWPA